MSRFMVLVSFIMCFSLVACDMQQHPDFDDPDKKELLVYSGMTMIQPLMEIIALVEAQENCRIKVTYGGSGHIYRSVEINKIGDVFFPGGISYIEKLKQQGLVGETALVGYNQAALFVQKGNPRHIANTLASLTDKTTNVVIGNETSGSIGRETKRILDQHGIYQQVVDNALYLTTDSKGLAAALRNKDADLVVNWRAIAYLPANSGYMDILPLAEAIAPKKPLVMGVLKYSSNPDLAKKLIDMAISPQGRAIFRKYGYWEN